MSGIDAPLRERLRDLAQQLDDIAQAQEPGVRPLRAHRPVIGEGMKVEWWLAQVRQITAARQLRLKYLPASLFGEAGWDILLELFKCDLQGRNATVKAACCAAEPVAPTTSLRWIVILEDEGLIARSSSPGDRRITWLSLTPKGVEIVRGYIIARDAFRNRTSPEMLLIDEGHADG